MTLQLSSSLDFPFFFSLQFCFNFTWANIIFTYQILMHHLISTTNDDVWYASTVFAVNCWKIIFIIIALHLMLIDIGLEDASIKMLSYWKSTTYSVQNYIYFNGFFDPLYIRDIGNVFIASFSYRFMFWFFFMIFFFFIIWSLKAIEYSSERKFISSLMFLVENFQQGITNGTLMDPNFFLGNINGWVCRHKGI